jgi:DNA-binding transcriptional LysR family regulator
MCHAIRGEGFPRVGSHILCRGEDWFVSQNGQGVTLMPVGEQYLKEVSGILHSLAVGTERSISDVSLDCLRLHSSPSFGLLWLMPRLKQFRQSHPCIQFNLSCSY